MDGRCNGSRGQLLNIMKLEQIRLTNIFLWLLLLAFFAVPSQIVYAQDMDDEGEMFLGRR